MVPIGNPDGAAAPGPVFPGLAATRPATASLSFAARPGGCPYTSAIAAARLGAPTSFLGRVGTDFLGDLLVKRLSDNGVDSSLVARREGHSTLAFVKREADGSARYAFYSKGAADTSLDAGDLPSRLGPGVVFLLVGSISLAQEPSGSTIEAFASREASRVLLSIDPNARPGLFGNDDAWRARLLRMIPYAAILRLSDEDLSWLCPAQTAEAAIADFLSMGPELVVLTRGASGSEIHKKGGVLRAKAVPVEVVDTIAAGDTFHAAFLASLLESGVRDRASLRALDEGQLRRALERAGAAAAMDCLRVGAEPPTAVELAAFMESRK
ncbi:MAG: carbohydrate kinase family protein [Rectinemataceae bacterium]